MDEQKLSEFIQRTKADPALAEDLLEATEWDLEAAMAAYASLNVTSERRKFESDSEEFVDLSVIHENYGTSGDGGGVTSDDTDTMILRRRGKAGKKTTPKGLTHVADEVGEVFWKVAVSETKLTIGATEKQNVFNEQFYQHSFMYPDISGENQEIREFVAGDIIEVSHKHILEKSNRLNWWSSTGKLPRLEPLGTSGDGNCLLHAVSLYMWGLPDRDLILRTHLHRALTVGREREGIRRRWRHVTTARNHEAGGLVFSEDEWDFEWHEIVRIATNQPRRRPTTDSLMRYSTLRINYESLEEIHVYAVAQVLQRPIIVIADQFLRDMNNEPLAPIYFGGIYLPLECSATSCFKSPLVLAYDSSHFSPLVAKREPKPNGSRLRRLPSKQDNVIPLVSPEGLLLPLMFLHDPDTKTDVREEWSRQSFAPNEIPDAIRSLLESYFDVRWIQLGIESKFQSSEPTVGDKSGFHIPVKVPQVRFPAAVVISSEEPDYQSLLVAKYLENAKQRYEVERARREKVAAERERQEEEYRRIQMNHPVPCVGKNCDMFGSQATNNLCSLCFSRSNSTQTDKPVQDDCPPEPKTDSETESDSGTEPGSRIESRATASEVDGDEKWEIILPDIPHSSEERQWKSTASVVRKEDLTPLDSKLDSKLQEIDPKPDPESHKTDPKPKKADHKTDPKPKKEPLKTDPKPKKADPKPHKTDPKPKKADSTSSSKPVTTTGTNTGISITTTPATIVSTATTTSSSTGGTSKPHQSQVVSTQSGVPSTGEKKTDAAASPKTKLSSFARLKSRFEPKPQASRGYSRDLIKPITVGKDGPTTATTAAAAAAGRGRQQIACISEGCEFFGSFDRKGYCSKCYNNPSKVIQ